MRFTFAAALAGAAFFAATPALAQDAPADDPLPFNGAYIGFSGGYDVQPNDVNSSILFDRGNDGTFGDRVTTSTGANAFGGTVGGFCNGRATGGTGPFNTAQPRGCTNDKNGYSYYARAGLDSQMGNLVVGVVGEFGRSEINDSVSAFSTTPASYTMYRELDWEASVRGRAGLALGDGLFYATFGPSYARIDRQFFTTNTANTFAQRGDRTQFGIVGGGGVEKKIGRNFSIGLEYLFHRYNDDDFRVRAAGATATNPFLIGTNGAGTDFRRSDPKFRWHSIRVNAGFRF